MSLTAEKTMYTLPEAAFRQLTDLRIQKPDLPLALAGARKSRESIAPDGKLNIIACDHPARQVNNIGPEPLAMADRADYLGRMLRVLENDAADGVMATMDILEELLLLQEITGKRFLDGKVLIASLNRGGLAGSAWEMDDPITAATPESCITFNLDGAKMLWRLCLEEPSSLNTMQACSDAINRCNQQRLPMFFEPLPVRKTASGYSVIKEAEELAKIAGIASAMGDSSRYLWLKLPACENFELVARATTLPILLLGGEATGRPEETLRQIQDTMQTCANVRGVMLGRNALYPGDGDPLAFAREIQKLVHG